MPARKEESCAGSASKPCSYPVKVLFLYQRELISETLNCSVANGYGGRESGLVTHECPQGGLHIMADATIVETVDDSGQPIAVGQPGEIVVTDLYSREAPFLLHATGDIGVLSTRACPCGRPLPLLENVVEGRTTDFVIAPDETILHALSIIYVLREIEGMEQFRVRQKSIDRFRLQIPT
jgi:phenylacetate-CoA ligase